MFVSWFLQSELTPPCPANLQANHKPVPLHTEMDFQPITGALIWELNLRMAVIGWCHQRCPEEVSHCRYGVWHISFKINQSMCAWFQKLYASQRQLIKACGQAMRGQGYYQPFWCVLLSMNHSPVCLQKQVDGFNASYWPSQRLGRLCLNTSWSKLVSDQQCY
jgi:hypothetical protein